MTRARSQVATLLNPYPFSSSASSAGTRMRGGTTSRPQRCARLPVTRTAPSPGAAALRE